MSAKIYEVRQKESECYECSGSPASIRFFTSRAAADEFLCDYRDSLDEVYGDYEVVERELLDEAPIRQYYWYATKRLAQVKFGSAPREVITRADRRWAYSDAMPEFGAERWDKFHHITAIATTREEALALLADEEVG